MTLSKWTTGRQTQQQQGNAQELSFYRMERFKFDQTLDLRFTAQGLENDIKIASVDKG